MPADLFLVVLADYGWEGVLAADAGVVAWAVAATPAVALALVAHQAGPLFAHMKEER